MKPSRPALVLMALSGLLWSGCGRLLPDEPAPLFLVGEPPEGDEKSGDNRFLPSGKNGLLAAPVTLADETRLSLKPPLASKLAFAVWLPPEPTLDFGYGVLSPGSETLPFRVEFRILVESGGERQTVFAEILRRHQANRWLDRKIDLRPWAASKVRLSFETRPQFGRDGPATPAFNGVVPLWSNPVLAGARTKPERPDIFLISIDCLRADHVGAYGYSRSTTPRIDRLAQDGVVFETAIGTAPETLPSHMSIFTGLPPSLHGASKRTRLPRSVAYLPEILAKSGYEVIGLVTGAFLSQSFGFERGFHLYRFIDQPGAQRTIDSALPLLRRAEGRSLFLWVHLFDPHWPYYPPREMIERFGPRPEDLSGLMEKLAQQDYIPRNDGEQRQALDLYDAEIAYLDRELGRLLDELRRTGLYEPSLIIVAGDHGEAFNEHGYWQHTLALYEEMIRVPLIVKWPGNTPRGRVRMPASLIDLFPSVLEEADLTAPPNDGIHLKRTGEGRNFSGERQSLSEAGWRSGSRFFWKVALRSESRKYIASFEGEARDGWPPAQRVQEELYDLKADPAESRDLSRDLVNEMGVFQQRLGSYLSRIRAARSTRKEEDVLIDEDLKNRLKALGYIIY